MTSAPKSWKWHWIPLTLILIGAISIVLFYAMHGIRMRQQANATLNDVILHMETETALFHLRMEDFISGEPWVEVTGAIASMDRAIGLAEAMQSGGDSELKALPELVQSVGLRTPAAELKKLLVSFKELGLQRARDPQRSGSGSPADFDFDVEFAKILEKTRSMEQVCKANRLATGRTSENLILIMYLAWGFSLSGATAAIWRVEMGRKAAESSLLTANAQLLSQAAELTEHRERLEELVLSRTAALTGANASLRVEIAERLQAEETLRQSGRQIRQLSAELLGAQEAERKRISRELHDEIGQALNVMKLRIRRIEKALGPGQAGAREDCEGLLLYLDEEIEEVRRLALALSPTVVGELGLASGLRWLISNFKRVHPLTVVSEVAEIDPLFPEEQRVTIYRVVQEALANVERHARAASVAVSIRLNDSAVDFVVADDGRGFDPGREGGTPAQGMGLGTMRERVRMMGGELRLASRPGQGTRISFSLPVAEAGVHYAGVSDRHRG